LLLEPQTIKTMTFCVCHLKPVFLAVGVSVCASKCAAQIFLATSGELNLLVPDGNPYGVIHSLSIDAGESALRVQDLTVSLNLSGGWAGDLYVQLTHAGGLSVLLNRVGRTETDELGYGESNLDLQLSSTPGLPDIHEYRLTLTGSPSQSIPAVTGLWAADGRAVDPSVAVASDPRTALLDTFRGADPGGLWTLYLVDQDAGHEFNLKSWSISVTAVPEPQTLVSLSALGLLIFGVGLRVARRQGKTTDRSQRC
jgi:subtilisin-like proprotein convertase family protein